MFELILTHGMSYLIGGLAGYLFLTPNSGLLRLPKVVERNRGWCAVALAVLAAVQISLPQLRMCRAVAQYVHDPCMANGLPPVEVSPVMFLCFSPPVSLALFDVLQMMLTGLGCALALMFVVWPAPTAVLWLRDFLRTASSGWTRLSFCLFALLAASAFFVEPLVRYGFLEPVRREAQGIAEIDDLVRRNDSVYAGGMERPQENAGRAILHPREPLLALYGRYGACTIPGHEHISRSELARLSPEDREFLVRVLAAWKRQRALELLKP